MLEVLRLNSQTKAATPATTAVATPTCMFLFFLSSSIKEPEPEPEDELPLPLPLLVEEMVTREGSAKLAGCDRDGVWLKVRVATLCLHVTHSCKIKCHQRSVLIRLFQIKSCDRQTTRTAKARRFQRHSVFSLNS